MLARRVGLRGRAAELERLGATLASAAAGTPFALVLEGEAGIGKSRLIEEATQAATGFRLMRGKASELDRERPFGPLLDALDLRRSDLAGLLVEGPGEEVPSVDAPRQFDIADHFIDLIEMASEDLPVVLVLEDVHWADSATLSLAARVARHRRLLNTSLLCTRRPAPRPAHLEALLKSLADEGAVEMRLGPLADAAVEDIVAELVGAAPGPTLSERVRGASGNPLYVIEFIEGLGHELARDDGVADVSDASAPPPLPLTIVRRLGLLPPATIDLLRTAAILGASFSLRDLAALERRPALELIPQLQPAIDGGVLAGTADGFRFRHDLLHEAAYGDIPEPARRLRHADAAATLAASPGPDVAQVARHFELASDGPDATASDWLWEAATAALTLDRSTGLDLMARSIARTPHDHPALLDRRVLEPITGSVLPGKERLDRLRELLREPLPEEHRWALEGALVTGLAVTGEVDEGELVAFATSRPLPAQLAMALSLVRARCLLGDPDGAERVIDRLVARATGDEDADTRAAYHYVRGLSDPDEVTDIWLAFCRALVAWARGENGAGPATARRLHELSRRVGALVQIADGAALLIGGDSSDTGWRDLLRWIDPSHGFPEIDVGAGYAYWLAGEWDEALTQFETARGRIEGAGFRLSSSMFVVPAWIEATRGNKAAAQAWLAESQVVPSSAGVERWVEAALAEVEGNLDRSRHLLIEAWRRDSAAGVRVWQKLYAADLVRDAVTSGDEQLALEVVSVMESLVQGGGEIVAAVAHHCRALLDASAADLIEVGGRFRQLGRPVEAARADEDLAVVVAASDAPRARALFAGAAQVYEKLGSRRDLARLAARSSEAGVSLDAASAPRPLTGWESLTSSELRVAELVSQGLTYRAIGERLFVSRRTVETHVAHVFVKLNVRSKAELAAAYAVRFRA